MKRAIKFILMAIGVAALLLFVWEVWGKDGRLGDFFLMIWDWFYAVASGIAEVLKQAFGSLN